MNKDDAVYQGLALKNKYATIVKCLKNNQIIPREEITDAIWHSLKDKI